MGNGSSFTQPRLLFSRLRFCCCCCVYAGLFFGAWCVILSYLQCKQKPKFLRSITNYQSINVDTLKVQNMETWPFFNSVNLSTCLYHLHFIAFAPCARPYTSGMNIAHVAQSFVTENSNSYILWSFERIGSV